MRRGKLHLLLRNWLLWRCVLNGCLLGCGLLSSSVLSGAAHADTITAAANGNASATATATTTASGGVRVTIIKTADAQVREALMVAGGNWSTMLTLNHVAVLVDHPQHTELRLMFDAGLSANVQAERQANLNWLYRQWPLLAYQHLNPARQQLPAALRPQVIVLSHIHWDHASGLADFPEAEVWVAPAERTFAEHAGTPAVFPTQVRTQSASWKTIAFATNNHVPCGFDLSYDVYGDGNVLLIAMPGHTPGSVAMLVTTGKGRKLLFVGDTVWLKRAVDDQLAKPLISRTADDTPAQVATQIERLAACVHSDAAIEIVPAHDGAVQDGLGYFPTWVE